MLGEAGDLGRNSHRHVHRHDVEPAPLVALEPVDQPVGFALVRGVLSQLSSLDLSMNEIGDAGVEAVANGSLSLKSLYLLGCQIGPAGAKTLAKAKPLANLEVLALSGNNLGDAGAQALAKSTALRNLHTLDLCANGIGDSGALALAQSNQLKKLKVLELFGNEIGSRGSAALRKRFGAGLHL